MPGRMYHLELPRMANGQLTPPAMKWVSTLVLNEAMAWNSGFRSQGSDSVRSVR